MGFFLILILGIEKWEKKINTESQSLLCSLILLPLALRVFIKYQIPVPKDLGRPSSTQCQEAQVRGQEGLPLPFHLSI